MMAITYTWSFPSLDVVYNLDGNSNVVTAVNWIYAASDGNYSDSCYGTIGLAPPGQPFIAYDDLTPQIVEAWVVDAMGQDEVDVMSANLAGVIAQKKNPKGGELPPPWES